MKAVIYKTKENLVYDATNNLYFDADGNVVDEINEIVSIDDVDDILIETDAEKLVRLEMELNELKNKLQNQ